MSEVYNELRQLCQHTAPDVFATLPDLSSTSRLPPTHPRAQRGNEMGNSPMEVTRIDSISIDDGSVRGGKVMCLQAADANTFWLGMDTGEIAALQFFDQTEHQTTSCSFADRHGQAVTALCFNSTKQSTIWSGSKDGRIFVWSAEIEQNDVAKSRCYLKDRLVVVKTNVKKLNKFKGQPIYCVLRNGWLHCYLDEHVGPPRFELDLNQPNVDFNVQSDGHSFELTSEAARLQLSAVGVDDATETVRRWQQTICHLVQISRTGRGLSRLASSAQKNVVHEPITALEPTDHSTWCLLETSLMEWHLVESQHGLHGQLRLEPGRSVKFDMACQPFNTSLQMNRICGVAWVAPTVLWIGVANTIGILNIEETAVASFQSHQVARDGSCFVATDTSSHVPSFKGCTDCQTPLGLLQRIKQRSQCQKCSVALCKKCWTDNRECKKCRVIPSLPAAVSCAETSTHFQPSLVLAWPTFEERKHGGDIQLLLVVPSTASVSGHEMWTYSPGEDILVWQTPCHERGACSPLFDDCAETNLGGTKNEVHCLVLLGQVKLANDGELPTLTCMKRVGNQVWAGTQEGTIARWDIATRSLLPRMLADHQSQEIKPITSITAAQFNKRTFAAISSSCDLVLHKYALNQALK